MNKDQIKGKIRNAAEATLVSPVTRQVCVGLIWIGLYSFAAKKAGYRMVRPVMLDNDTGTVYAQTITGKLIRSVVVD